MASSVKIRTKRQQDTTEIRVLIAHPMETGRRRETPKSPLIVAHYIQQLIIKHNNDIIANIQTGASISKNPYFAFILQGGEVGDKITVTWQDNLGNMDIGERLISE